MEGNWIESDAGLPEVPLEGGDVTEGLVRVGDTVRRPRLPSSNGVRLLLEHLERVGFDGAPRHLGVDARERDVLSYVDGEVATRPWPEWVADEGRLVSLARLVRRYDDAAVLAGLPEWAEELRPVHPPGSPSSTAPAARFLAHLDITPENVVFRDGTAQSLIDFDLARPATRVEEMANLLLWWAPWMPVEDRQDALREADPFRRARLAVEAYGLSAEDRALLVPVSRNIADRSWFSMRHRAETLGGGWRRMWDEGVGDVILRRREWLAAHARELDASVR
ncbi:phosphotransferase [Frondihabitans cladoniiphilus]|uniref:Aminoglycoside phosphotransferase domain-containing protein n=1 Tax=Frondihabitans cladoniiphilus TaxID=715785 RepID=A0ABP8VSK1_9MICO